MAVVIRRAASGVNSTVTRYKSNRYRSAKRPVVVDHETFPFITLNINYNTIINLTL